MNSKGYKELPKLNTYSSILNTLLFEEKKYNIYDINFIINNGQGDVVVGWCKNHQVLQAY